MFSKTSSVSAALVAVIASILGGAAASPILSTRDVSAPSGGLALLPTPMFNADFIANDLSLGHESNYYWANEGILANMTVKAADSFRLLNSQDFKDVVQSVNCSASTITMKFNSRDSMKAAKNAWGWVNKATANVVVYIVDGGACGGKNGRQPYYIKSVSYNEKVSTAIMSASIARWRDFAEDATLRIQGPPAGTGAKRAFGDISKSTSIDFNHDYNGPIFITNVDGVIVTVTCDDCKSTGSLDADMTLSLTKGLEASMTTQNSFGIRVAVGLKAAGSLTQPIASASARLATIPLAGFSIAGVAEIGPQLTFDAQASISGLNAQVSTQFGLAMTLPDGSTLAIGKESPDLQPNFERIGPSLNGQVSLSAKINPLVTLNLAATFLGKGLVGGIGLQAPTLSATVKAAGSTNDAACDNSNAAVSFSIDVGMSVDAFGGFGSAQDQPNKIPIFSRSTPLFSECLLTA